MIGRMRVTDTRGIQRIHEASLRILQRTGMLVAHRGAQEMLAGAGCKIEPDSQRVRFPPELVTEMAARVPKRVVVAGRTPERDVVLGEDGQGPVLRPALGIEQLLDHRTGEVRGATQDDLKHWTILADALPHMGYNAVLSPVDVHLPSRDVLSAAVALRCTTKHVHALAYSGRAVDYLARLAAVIVGSSEEVRLRPALSFFQVAISPLQITGTGVDRILAAGRHRIPVFLNSSPIMGGTAPISIAGCTALLNAEILAMNTILQLGEPGSPMVYTIRSSAMDMKTTQSCWGVIEVSIAQALAVQLAKEMYGFITDVYGPSTESKLLDLQDGVEKGKTAFLPILAGADVVAGAGNLESQATISLPQMLVDDELFASLQRVLDPVPIDDDELAVDVIDQVGPKGQYLGCDHTLSRYRRAVEATAVFDRSFRRTWEDRGRPQVLERATARTEKLLAGHVVPPLLDEQLREIEEITREAEATLEAVDS